MTEKENQQRGRRAPRRGTARAVVVALASVLAFAGSGTTSASAATYAASTGSPGHLWVSPVAGRGHHTSSGEVKPGLKIDSTTFGRSPATRGQQKVYFQHSIFEWVSGSGWQYRQGTTWQYGVIPAGSASNYTLPSYQQLHAQQGSTGYWQAYTTFVWFDSATNQRLGTRIVHWNRSGDYACEASRYVYCQAGPGWVRVI